MLNSKFVNALSTRLSNRCRNCKRKIDSEHAPDGKCLFEPTSATPMTVEELMGDIANLGADYIKERLAVPSTLSNFLMPINEETKK